MSIIRYTHPDTILLAALAYCVGAGIAKYLGTTINWPAFILGLLVLLPLLGASYLLNHYYRLLAGASHGKDEKKNIQYSEARLIHVISVFLFLSCGSVIALLFNRALDLTAGICLCFVVFFLLALEIAPFRLKSRGYGELVIAIVLASFFPLFSFLLQTNVFNRILLFITFPLTIQAIAWQIAGNFSNYAADKKNGQGSLVLQLTWQKAIYMHHVCLLVSILLFLATPFVGMPWRLVWPLTLALPFLLMQIFWLQRIANGGKPLWKFFNILISSTFGLSVYLLVFSFWFR